MPRSKLKYTPNRVNEWLYANNLSLNIEKFNFVLSYPPQKKANFSMNLEICGRVRQMKIIRYLGVLMDGHLNWKTMSMSFLKEIGILLKLRHFVSTHILKQVYHSVIYSFLTYAVMFWGNTYKTNIQPLMVLQEGAR